MPVDAFKMCRDGPKKKMKKRGQIKEESKKGKKMVILFYFIQSSEGFMVISLKKF